ncbi:carboxyl transferase domain-containing protein [Streptomyces sp. MBT62]|uniref:carboxyl transferase domain-containing protein n=1 Tax=Streptomyces sp. MBT62 TaxID=2800410 RepID=UPI00190DF5EA|nr:carboxyl transferase domain-containing protein [Streptomyces sp. MBT62]MBK3571561.1 acetyl-CoA carboxylase carboxyl transferase subunit alpha/beta [Streptomyces sp. MBT62]
MTDRRSAREILALVTDDLTFAELPYPVRESGPDGPLAWEGYDASRARAADRTGESESVVCGTAAVGGTRAVLIAFEFGFLGGSLGERTGDRIEAAYTYAREHRLPVVPLVATGGSRMQEGMIALTQLQRVARQSVLTREAGLAQIAVLRDPTTGGGWATLGAGADVVLALPGAQVGFAGSRVRPPDADPSAYTAEAQVAAGAADAIVGPEELRETLGRWLRLLTTPWAGQAPVPAALGASGLPTAGREDSAPAVGATDPRPPAQDTSTAREDTALAHGADAPPVPAQGTVQHASNTQEGPSPACGAKNPPAPAQEAVQRTSADQPATGWEAVQRARNPQRPRAERYLDDYFTHRLAIGGDRCGGTDAGMLCGFGERAGRTIAFAAQAGTATRPAGYRTAARLIRLADRLGVPVLTLVDTPGAANDAEAERQGAGAAIADLFGAVASVRVPVTTLLIGEGGSGGALALAAPGNTWATPDSYFSVIAPELATAILKRAPAETERTADQLRVRPEDLAELGVIRTRPV